MGPSIYVCHDNKEDSLIIQVIFHTFIICISHGFIMYIYSLKGLYCSFTAEIASLGFKYISQHIFVMCFDCRNLGGTTCLHSWHFQQSCSCVSCPSSLRVLATCWWREGTRKGPEEVLHICNTALRLHFCLVMHASNVDHINNVYNGTGTFPLRWTNDYIFGSL